MKLNNSVKKNEIEQNKYNSTFHNKIKGCCYLLLMKTFLNLCLKNWIFLKKFVLILIHAQKVDKVI